jgi:D-methionine transport system permease protein
MTVINLVLKPTLDTLIIVGFASLFSVLLGFPLGIILTLTDKNGLSANKLVYSILDGFINVVRSFPFLILMILLFPLSRLLIGTTIGTTATIVPLSVAAAPFVGRIIEGALKEVDHGLIESAISCGSNHRQIVFKVLIPEAMPSIVHGITLTIINIVGYSAMAGVIGGGGLGDLAIRYGFYRFQTDVMIIAVLVIIGLVQIIQFFGNYIVKQINFRR